jgi:16S rRNA C967 or C1407 C5-methylase (RsmB/RsmF family)
MKAIERHRQTWQGKSDEWLFERLDNELKQKVEEIHRLLAENEALRQFDVIRRSEQLKAFADYAQKRVWEDGDKDLSEFVDEFLRL